MHFDVRIHGDPPDRAAQVVLKVPNGNNGPRVVVNELLVAELAFRLGLPCPEPLLVEIPRGCDRVKLRCAADYLAPGLAFALPYIPSEAPLTERHVRAARHLVDLPGIFAFDTWVYNLDRTTPGNLLAQPAYADHAGGGWHIWMIDHEYTFGGVDWTAKSLVSDAAAPAHPCLDIVEPTLCRPTALARWITALQRVPAALLAQAIALVPAEWLADPAERRALLVFLLARQAQLPDLVSDYLAPPRFLSIPERPLSASRRPLVAPASCRPRPWG